MKHTYLFALTMLGCTAPLGRTPLTPSQECVSLDNTHRTWGATSKFSAVLAGSGGLATLPFSEDQKTLRASVAISALLMGGLAAASVYIEQDAAQSYTAQGCGK